MSKDNDKWHWWTVIIALPMIVVQGVRSLTDKLKSKGK